MKMRLGQVVVSALLAATAVAALPLVAAASATYMDTVAGPEIFATSTQGKFVGQASGALPGFWYANVVHTALSGGSATITGGTFSLATALSSQPAVVTGAFSGGSVRQTGGFTGCANQTYAVSGNLIQVGPAGGAHNSSGIFLATLTHYRTQFFGTCVTYAASVAGTVSLTF